MPVLTRAKAKKNQDAEQSLVNQGNTGNYNPAPPKERGGGGWGAVGGFF